jgi:hypothetical protein
MWVKVHGGMGLRRNQIDSKISRYCLFKESDRVACMIFNYILCTYISAIS